MCKDKCKFIAFIPGVNFAELYNENAERKCRHDVRQNREKQIRPENIALPDKNCAQTERIKQPRRRIINPKLIVFRRHRVSKSVW